MSPPVYTNPIRFDSGVLLSEDTFHLVNDFTCARPGHPEDRFEQDVSQWLTNPGREGAREAARLGLAEVRLYLHTDGQLIGFGAIGPDSWELAEGGPLRLCLLHYFGVHTRFRHQPEVDRKARYGRRLLGGLIEEVDHRADFPLLGLYVDPANPARGLYEEFGFQLLDEWPDPDDEGRPWVRMLREIRS